MAALEAEGGADAARYVGGCVRDTLLRLPAAMSPEASERLDVDVATRLAPSRVLAALARAGLKAVPTGIEHGTVTAVSARRPYEITTLRQDVRTDGRHAEVAFTEDWLQDARRRDFRLNALYAASDGRLYDPTGLGVADALAGRVVFVGDARRRIVEDHLRILRFFRFQAWYGRGAPDAEALAACAELAAGVATLSAERVAKELLKLLAAPDPLSATIAMAQAGVLDRLPFQADVGRLGRVCGLAEALDLAPDAGLRLAALSVGDPGGLAKALRLPNALRDRLQRVEGPIGDGVYADDPAARRSLYAVGAQTLRDRILLGSELGDLPRLKHLIALADAWNPPDFPVSGIEIEALGVPHGPEVGRIRRELEAWWMAGDFTTDAVEVRAALKRIVARRAVEAAELSGRARP